MNTTFEQAKAFFLSGLAHYEAGRMEAADRDFSASLSLVPGRPSTLTNLGATRLQLGRADEALVLLQEALNQEPTNPETLGHAATALAELGRRGDALAMADRAVQADPQAAVVWTLRGTLLREAGRPSEAAASWREALRCGAPPELIHYYLAALGEEAPPSAPPRLYVQQLFDSYAEGFDRHLVQVLHYRAPERLVQGLKGRIFDAVLDLGCGTGLCGPLLRPLARRLDGVDLSANMVAQARASGVYDSVEQDDAAHWLQAAPQRWDAIVAADVFIYVGALEGVFAGASQALRPGGVFCFSVEEVDDGQAPQGYALRESLRYAHSMGYIRMLAEQHGFSITAHEREPLRQDQGKPVPGLFAWLSKR
jgi:predicted TPR repeat methyltransferase